MTHTQATSGTKRRPSHQVSGGHLRFNLSEEIAELRADLRQSSGGRSAKTLVKNATLRVTLILAAAKVTIEPAAVAGAATLQMLQGRLRLPDSGEAQEVGAGELVLLESNLEGPLNIIEESAFLLTVDWPADAGAVDEEFGANSETNVSG